MRKGEETRDRILDLAVRVARRDGLDGLTIGSLATETGLSKSGLFAHFGSKESLQIQVLAVTADRFTERVVKPALTAPRGLPRVRAIFDRWLEWIGGRGQGGCVLLAASMELDDRPGPLREYLVNQMRALLGMLARATSLALQERHFRADLDVEQLAFEWHGVMLAYHLSRRLLRDGEAERRARHAFERLLEGARR